MKQYSLLVATALSATLITGCATLNKGSNGFPDDVYATLKDSGQVAKFPGKVIWKGEPAMLYDSVTPDGKRLVVSSPKNSSIYIFDTKNGNRLGEVKVGKASKGLKVSPNGKEVYVANEGEASVSVVNLDNYTLITTIQTEEMPHNIRFSDDGKIAYVTLQGGAGLGLIDTQTHQVTRVIPTPGLIGAHNLDLSKDGKTAFIRDTSNSVGILDLASGEMKKVITVGQGHAGIDVTPNGKYAATGAIADDIVSIIDTATLEVVKQIKVGFGPHGVRASTDNKWLYVVVTADNKFVVIDMKKMEVAQEFPLGDFPFWVAVKGNP